MKLVFNVAIAGIGKATIDGRVTLPGIPPIGSRVVLGELTSDVKVTFAVDGVVLLADIPGAQSQGCEFCTGTIEPVGTIYGSCPMLNWTEATAFFRRNGWKV